MADDELAALRRATERGEPLGDETFIASGSEGSLILAAEALLKGEGIGVRCVSMPSWDLFDAQPLSYRAPRSYRCGRGH